MVENDRFKFEDEGYDFPFYNKIPYIPKWGWIVLFLTLVIGILLTISDEIYITILGCIVLIVPVLYFLKWDYKAILRMPSPKEFGLAVALFAGYLIYGIAMGVLLEQVGIVSPGLIEEGSVTVMSTFSSIFSIMGEEFLKFIPLMFFLRVAYKFSNNRKLSVVISVALVMIMFAAMHAYTPVMFVYALFIQGFGSIFEFFGYIKTKNIMIPYISHLLTDVFIFIFFLLGMA